MSNHLLFFFYYFIYIKTVSLHSPYPPSGPQPPLNRIPLQPRLNNHHGCIVGFSPECLSHEQQQQQAVSRLFHHIQLLLLNSFCSYTGHENKTVVWVQLYDNVPWERETGGRERERKRIQVSAMKTRCISCYLDHASSWINIVSRVHR